MTMVSGPMESARAKWSWKAKQYVVQIRPAAHVLILQQLLYADEVRSMKELDIEKVSVSQAELQLALQLIDQISEDAYDPSQYQDEEKKRVLAAIDDAPNTYAPTLTAGKKADQCPLCNRRTCICHLDQEAN